MGDYQRRTTRPLPEPERKPDTFVWHFALTCACIVAMVLALMYLTRG